MCNHSGGQQWGFEYRTLGRCYFQELYFSSWRILYAEVEGCTTSRSFTYPKGWKAGEGELQKPRGLLGTETVMRTLKVTHTVLLLQVGQLLCLQCCLSAVQPLPGACTSESYHLPVTPAMWFLLMQTRKKI